MASVDIPDEPDAIDLLANELRDRAQRLRNRAQLAQLEDVPILIRALDRVTESLRGIGGEAGDIANDVQGARAKIAALYLKLGGVLPA